MREAFIPRIQNHTPIYAPELINYFSSNYLNAHETVFYEVPIYAISQAQFNMDKVGGPFLPLWT